MGRISPEVVFEHHVQWSEDHDRDVAESVNALISFDNLIVSSSEDGAILAMRKETLEYRELMAGHAANDLYLSPCADLFLAASDDGFVHVFAADTLAHKGRLGGGAEGSSARDEDDRTIIWPPNGVRRARISVDGSVIAGCNNGHVKMWRQVDAPDEVVVFKEHQAPVDAVAIHPSEPLALTNDMSGRTLLWDMEKQRLIREIEPATGTFVRGIFHHGAHQIRWTKKWIVVGAKPIRVYDQDFNVVRRIRGLEFEPSAIEVRGDDLLTVGWYVKTFDLNTGDEVASTKSDELQNTSTLVAEHLYTGTDRGNVFRWQLDKLLPKKRTPKHAKKLYTHGGDVTSAVCRGPCLLSASADGSIIRWENAKGVARYEGDDKDIAVLDFIDEVRALVVENGHAKVINSETMEIECQAFLGKFFSYQAHVVHKGKAAISQVGDCPIILDLESLTTMPLDFGTALYEYSNVCRDRVLLCGYSSIPTALEDNLQETIDPALVEGNLAEFECGLALRYAPVVALDLDKGELGREYWFGEGKRYGEWGTEKNYPTRVVQFDDYFVAGFCKGQVIKWNLDDDEPAVVSQPASHYIQGLHATSTGDWLINAMPRTPLLLLNDALETISVSDISRPHETISLRYFDAANNVALVAHHDNDHVYRIDATTLLVIDSHKMPGLAHTIIKGNNQYFAFAGGKCNVIPRA